MSTATQLFRRIPVAQLDKHEMLKMRGNEASRRLIIAPPCTPFEYEQGMPFCDEGARLFHELLRDHAALNTDEDFLVVSCNRYGLKPNKQSTKHIETFIRKCAEDKLFDLYVCIGPIAFKHIFGYGKNPATSVIGNIIHVEQTKHAKLFTFPDTASLVIDFDDTTRNEYTKERIRDDAERKFVKLIQLLSKHIVR